MAEAEEIQATEETPKKKSFLDHILDGINFMLPCVVAGGILIGLAYMFDDISLGEDTFGQNTALASFFYTTGHSVFDLMLPVLAAGIGYSLAGVSAIAPGLAGGYICSVGNSGFLGALLAGFIAGYSIILLEKICAKIPESLSSIKTLLIYPLVSVLVMGLLATYVLEPIVGAIMTLLTGLLSSMTGGSKVLLGFILGAMASVDMGGPVNKTAYLFGVGMLAEGQYDIMAAVLAGEMVPPYVTGLASLIFKNKFTSEQRSNGIANLVIGLAGVTEAAIPYWAADPKAVIISCVAGSGIAGALSEFFECSVMAPFGGFFILPLFEHPFLFLLSLGIGIAVGTVLYGLLAKKPEQPEATTEAENA